MPEGRGNRAGIMVICVWRGAVQVGDHLAQPAGYYPAGRTTEQLLGDYFGIDLEEAERERQAVLEWLRRQQEELRGDQGRSGERGFSPDPC